MKLQFDQLSVLLPLLEKDFPASFNIYFLVRNTVRQKLAWPGLEFFVDSFPDASVCICRTASTKQTEIPPFFNGYCVFVYSKDKQKLAQLISEEGVIDWTETISFCMIKVIDDLDIIKAKCQELNGTAEVVPGSNFYDNGVMVSFDLNGDDVSYEYELPEGLRLGSLAVEHAEQVTKDKYYGDPEINLKFFRYILQAGYASSALFNNQGRPVAYIIQRPENSLGVGFVAEEYRSRGLFKIVVYELLKKMKLDGETESYADVAPNNTNSLNTMLRVGGTLYSDVFQWFEFRPAQQNN